VTAVAVCAALWAVLNALISPFFWQFTHMPFLCDLLAFAALILVVWWTRRFGAASLTGVVFGVLSLILRPGAFFNVAFVVAAIVFDFLTRGVGYERMFNKPVVGSIVAVLISRKHAAPLAYIAGSMGCLLGADLLNLNHIRELGAPVASIGGAGISDGIFLTGIIAVLLA